jgi:hypothetical protein
MGAWGTGIFEDDLASDVRDGYTELLGEGWEGPAATLQILGEHADALDDPDDAPVLWIALATIQWQKGRLEQSTLQHALDAIDSRAALSRWDAGTLDYPKREWALAKARERLLSPQKPATKPKKRYLEQNEWQVGQLIAYRLLSGRFIVFRVARHYQQKGVKLPICEILDWTGDRLPWRYGLRFTRVKLTPRPKHRYREIVLLRQRERDRPEHRLTRLPRRLTILDWPTRLKTDTGAVFCDWKNLDDFLAQHFKLE